MKKVFLTAVVIIAIIGAGVIALVFWYRTGGLQKKIVQQIENRFNPQTFDNANSVSSSVKIGFWQGFLGFDKPKTYLLLFLNNTELRPAGGFIGVYAVVKIDKGIPNMLKVEGTEVLDNYAPQNFISVPPEPIARYLKVKRWLFRDSNWSPDFASSSIKSLELYKKENGLAADQIDAVIGFTPTVIEEVLKITGPIKYDGLEFNSANFTEKLEYEVEYAYKNKGVDFNDRKDILGGLGSALIKKVSLDLLLHWNKYLELVDQMISQRHILAYSSATDMSEVFKYKGMDGRIKNTTGDYLMWVDANLGAWKTDAALSRKLSYSFAPDKNGKYLATLKMTYVHGGVFDWRTSRYLTYARVFLPLGSELVSVSGALDGSGGNLPGKADVGIEDGKQWFGAFTTVEPLRTRELIWKFYLAPSVAQQVRQGSYTLLFQKQSGTIGHGLTLGLDFGKNIVSATPGEKKEKHGDTRYDYTTDLKVDREFKVAI